MACTHSQVVGDATRGNDNARGRARGGRDSSEGIREVTFC